MILWKNLLGKGCSHRFSWPRIDADGRHYQICLHCGTAYEYDWTMMRRTERTLPMRAAHDMEILSNQPRPSQSTP